MTDVPRTEDPADGRDQKGERGRISTARAAGAPFALVITDPNLDDNPIIYVNKAFERITQYTADYAVGRNCRFLQGENTEQAEIDRIRDGIAKGEDVSVDVINYRADGTPFNNRLLIAPLFAEDGTVVNYLGIQRAMPHDAKTGGDARRDDAVEQGLRRGIDRQRKSEQGDDGDPISGSGDDKTDWLSTIRAGVEDHLTMVMNLVRLDGEDGHRSPRSLGRRIESLQLLYEELDDAGVTTINDETVPVGAYLSRVAATLNHIEGRRSIRMNVDCDALELPTRMAARLGLVLSELVLNALRHAFVGRRNGLVNVEFKLLTENRVRMSVKDDGRGMDEVDWPFNQNESAEDAEERRTGLRVGAKLVRTLVAALNAQIDVRSSGFGTTVELSLNVSRSAVRSNDSERENARQS